MTNRNTLTVDTWEAKDILTNMATLNERLEHLTTVASLATSESTNSQLQAILQLMKDSLNDMRIVAEHDHERMAELITNA